MLRNQKWKNPIPWWLTLFQSIKTTLHDFENTVGNKTRIYPCLLIPPCPWALNPSQAGRGVSAKLTLSSVGAPLSPHGFCQIYLSTEPQFTSSQLREWSYFPASWFLSPWVLTLCPALAPLKIHLQILETLWVLVPLWPSLSLQLHSFLVSLAAIQLIDSCKWRSQERQHTN